MKTFIYLAQVKTIRAKDWFDDWWKPMIMITKKDHRIKAKYRCKLIVWKD